MRHTTTYADLAEEHQVWAWLAKMWAKVAENYEGARAMTIERQYHIWSRGVCQTINVLGLCWCITRRLRDRMLSRVQAELWSPPYYRGVYLAPFDAAGARVRAAFCARMARETLAERAMVAR